jgi:hypothetical protein
LGIFKKGFVKCKNGTVLIKNVNYQKMLRDIRVYCLKYVSSWDGAIPWIYNISKPATKFAGHMSFHQAGIYVRTVPPIMAFPMEYDIFPVSLQPETPMI